jgi:hypothetical protein
MTMSFRCALPIPIVLKGCRRIFYANTFRLTSILRIMRNVEIAALPAHQYILLLRRQRPAHGRCGRFFCHMPAPRGTKKFLLSIYFYCRLKNGCTGDSAPSAYFCGMLTGDAPSAAWRFFVQFLAHKKMRSVEISAEIVWHLCCLSSQSTAKPRFPHGRRLACFMRISSPCRAIPENATLARKGNAL